MVSIHRATADEVPALAPLIANAFLADPIQVWTFPGDRLQERGQRFFHAYTRAVAARGWLWTAEDGVGVLMVAPPGSTEALTEVDTSVDPIVRAGSGDGGTRYHALWGWVEAHRPIEPHCHLDLLAVVAERRGRGLGTALLRHGLAMARYERAPAFLVASHASIAAFYARHGFVVTHRGVPAAGGPELRLMRWDP